MAGLCLFQKRSICGHGSRITAHALQLAQRASRGPLLPAAFGWAALPCLGCFLAAMMAAPAPSDALRAAVVETPFLRFQVSAETGAYEIADRKGGVTWRSNPYQARFGEATIEIGGKPQRADLAACELTQRRDGLEAVFHPLTNQPAASVQVSVRVLKDRKTLEFAYSAAPLLKVQSVRLLDDALWGSDREQTLVLVPVREGLLIPADSGLAFTHNFDTYAYEGCHAAMLGVMKQGAAAMLTWADPYVAAEVRSAWPNAGWLNGKQALSTSLVLRKSAKSFRLHVLGRGDYVTIGKAYRQVAKERGWLVTWSEKLKGHPERARLFGAVNYKLWSVLSRSMNEESTKEESVRVNWTFDEAAQVAEHLKRDLKLDKVLFLMGGWIRRGYDNQHPDILPAAPECGGNEAFAACSRRIRQLGYVFGLHDNYQDMYRDSPSWDEDYLTKNADGKIARGGRWAGGRAYLTCSQKAVELAKRPQNLPAVKELTAADAYFIDTTYAAGLMECYDPKHPLTRSDDMKWKQAISDYARDLFGIFGSECGREWAIPHSDFFEGLTGVSGQHYHDTGLLKKLGAVPVPLFEMVYRDCIAMHGKYGYDPATAAQYVLHHLIIGRPLNYHSIPSHLYWQRPAREAGQLAVRPGAPKFEATAPRQFRITYRWAVEQPPGEEWRVFVHFTDEGGAIKFQNDHEPTTPSSRFSAGQVEDGPFTVDVPEGLSGAFDLRVGLFKPTTEERGLLLGRHDGERRYSLGKLRVAADKLEFTPAPSASLASPPAGGDPGVFTRADNGWAQGLHPLDRFVKNTYEILSPLYELTAQTTLTAHQFLSPDRLIQRSVFGAGKDTLTVTVNAGSGEWRCQSQAGDEVLLPPYGFLVDSPTFAAFHALSWGGLRYEKPVLFTLRALDGKPLNRSGQVRVFHAFGDARIQVGAKLRAVDKEATVRE